MIFVTGLVLCYYIIGHIYKKENIYTPDAMEKLFIYAVLGIFGGARLGHCLFYDFEYFSAQLQISVAYFCSIGLYFLV